MLPAGTSKAYHQAFESALNIVFNINVDNIKNTVQEFGHPCLLLDIIHHCFVTTVHGLKFYNTAGIQNPPAIKNKSAAVATFILRNSLPV